MANSQAVVSALYAKVVSDVIAKSREEFLGEGLDATVLEELRVRWERKLKQSGVAPTVPAAAAAAAKAPSGPAQTAPAPPAPSAPSAPAPAPPAPAPPPPPPPPPPPQAARDEPLALLGRPLAFLPAATGWITETENPPPPPAAPAPAPTVTHTEPSLPQDAGRKRKAPDSTCDAAGVAGAAQAQAAPLPPAPVAPASEDADSPDEDELSSDSEKDAETNNLVLSQFEKVSHTKNKWKCTLKSGVMTLNGKDRVFSTATGAFSW